MAPARMIGAINMLWLRPAFTVGAFSDLYLPDSDRRRGNRRFLEAAIA
jgi:hypothetical protein